MDEKVQQVFKRGWRDIKNDEAALRVLAEYQTSVQGSAPCCLGVIEQFFYQTKIKIHQKKSPMKTVKSNYKLNPNAVLRHPFEHGHVTNANLTDEIAQAILKKNPGKASMFEIIPAQESEGDSGSGSQEDLNLKTAKELKAMLEGKLTSTEINKLKTKAVLIAKIQELN